MARTTVRSDLALQGGLRLSEAADFPAGAKAGQTCFRAGVLYVRGEVGGVQAWFPINAPQGHHVHLQGAAAQVWEVNHGFTGDNVAILAYADNGDAIPATVANSGGLASIDVGSSRTGYAVVFGLAFASIAQGEKADSAVQPGALATVATSGAYDDLIGVPSSFPPASHDHSGHHALEADLTKTLTDLTAALNQGATDIGAITVTK